MKRILLVLALLALPMTACKPVTNTVTPLAPGYTNTTDQQLGSILVAAHNFYTTIQADAAAGKYTPSPTEKTSLNNFATALNAAQLVYLSYHNGAATLAQAQAAVATVQAQQTQLQSTITGGTK